jgi:hypothetical protein
VSAAEIYSLMRPSFGGQPTIITFCTRRGHNRALMCQSRLENVWAVISASNGIQIDENLAVPWPNCVCLVKIHLNFLYVGIFLRGGQPTKGEETVSQISAFAPPPLLCSHPPPSSKWGWGIGWTQAPRTGLSPPSVGFWSGFLLRSKAEEDGS